MVEVRRTHRIVGFVKLREMLQPVHHYYDGKHGFVEGFAEYRHTPEQSIMRADWYFRNPTNLLYPRIKAMHRENPYRKHQLNARTGNQSRANFKQFVNSMNVADMRLDRLVLPYQGEISKHLAKLDSKRNGHKTGVNMAWGLFKRFRDALETEIPDMAGVAWRVNLHTWSTKNPLHPHYHHHAIITNYRLVQTDVVMPDGTVEGVQESFKKRPDGPPFTPDQLLILKTLWLKFQVDLARRHKIVGAFPPEVMEIGWQKGFPGLLRYMRKLAGTGIGIVNVYVEPKSIKITPGDAPDDIKMLNFAIKYNSRHYSENYCEYTHKNPNAPNPPGWARHYDNRTRLFGWWGDLYRWITPFDPRDDDDMKISPYTGGPLELVSRNLGPGAVIDGIIAGTVGAVEVLRGQAINRALGVEAAAWLESVAFPLDVDDITAVRDSSYAAECAICEELGESAPPRPRLRRRKSEPAERDDRGRLKLD